MGSFSRAALLGGRGFWGIYGQRVLVDAHLNVAKTI